MDNARLTEKQKAALEPLEAEKKTNRKERDRLQRRLALASYIGFEESKAVKERIAELDEAYTNLSVKISHIYAAESEMMKHMRKAMAEVEEVKRIAYTWGFEIEV